MSSKNLTPEQVRMHEYLILAYPAYAEYVRESPSLGGAESLYLAQGARTLPDGWLEARNREASEVLTSVKQFGPENANLSVLLMRAEDAGMVDVFLVGNESAYVAKFPRVHFLDVPDAIRALITILALFGLPEYTHKEFRDERLTSVRLHARSNDLDLTDYYILGEAAVRLSPAVVRGTTALYLMGSASYPENEDARSLILLFEELAHADRV